MRDPCSNRRRNSVEFFLPAPVQGVITFHPLAERHAVLFAQPSMMRIDRVSEKGHPESGWKNPALLGMQDQPQALQVPRHTLHDFEQMVLIVSEAEKIIHISGVIAAAQGLFFI